jgi:hypothetical protein
MLVTREVIMRIRIMSPILGLALTLAALPAVGCELHQTHADRSMVTALLANPGAAATPVQSVQPAACQADGSGCKVDGDCCSGSCGPMAEGLACAGK